MAKIQLRRGNHVNLPTSGMEAGEPLVALDRGNLYVATAATTKIPITPAIEALAAMPAIDGVNDSLLMSDFSETGQKEKKVAFNTFKAALNIPAASSDEKVAVISGGTAGYLWGTDGTDGLLRMNTTMSWTKDASNGFVTLAVGTIDCGSF